MAAPSGPADHPRWPRWCHDEGEAPEVGRPGEVRDSTARAQNQGGHGGDHRGQRHPHSQLALASPPNASRTRAPGRPRPGTRPRPEATPKRARCSPRPRARPQAPSRRRIVIPVAWEDSQRWRPAALEWTPFMTSSFSRCTSGTRRDRTRIRRQGRRRCRPVPEGRLGHVRPSSEGAVCFVEDVQRVVEEPVVGQGQAGRTPLDESPQGVERQGEVEVRRRRRRPQDAGIGQLHSDRIAGEQHPAQGVVQGEMVLGVTG